MLYGVMTDYMMWKDTYGSIDDAKADVETFFKGNENEINERDVQIVALHTVAEPIIPPVRINWYDYDVK